MTLIQTYALKILANYAEAGIEDDTDEDGELSSDEEWTTACDLALDMVRAIRANPTVILELTATWKGQPEPFNAGDGPVPGYVAGACGHRVAESEWKAGFRNCERCGS